MIKVQDFATKYGVTDRQVQRLLKKHEDEMAGHFERQGSNGTWIDETGEKILRSKMRQAPIIVQDSEIGQRIALLEQENQKLKDKLILAMEKVQEQQVLLDRGQASQLLLQAAEEQAKQTAHEMAELHQQLGAVLQKNRDLENAADALTRQHQDALKAKEDIIEAKNREIADMAVESLEYARKLKKQEDRIQELESRSRWQRLLDVFKK